MKKKIVLFLRVIAPFLTFFLISLLLHLLAVKGDLSLMINGGDIDYPINAWLEVKRSFSVWSGEALGVPEFFAISKLFLVIPQLLIGLFVKSITITNLLYFSLLRALPGTFMYYLLKYLRINKLGVWVASLFFMFNTFIYLRFQFPQPHLYYAYASLPLLTLLSLKIAEGKVNAYLGAGLFAIILAAISRTANIYILYFGLVPLITFICMKLFTIRVNIRISQLISAFFIVFALNVIIFASFLGAKLDYSNLLRGGLLEQFRQDAIAFAGDYKLHETLSGFGSYAWTHGLSSITPGEHNFPILGFFSKGTLLALNIIPIMFVIVFSLKNIRLLWPALLCVFIFGVLANGFGLPFGELYSMAATKIPLYLDFFRDSWTYWSMPYFFLISLLLGIAFNRVINIKDLIKVDSEKFMYTLSRVLILFILSVIFILSYLMPGKILNPAWTTKIPYGYLEIAEFLNKHAQGQKVLALPLTRHLYGYTYYSWGYAGPDIMHRLADVEYIDKYYNQIATNKTIDILNSIDRPDSKSFNEFLFRTQTNWILLRKDFVDIPGSGTKERVDEFRKLLSNFECWKIVSEYGELSLYENKCNDHARAAVQVTPNYTYGGNSCMFGLPINVNIPGASVCGKVPKNSNFSIKSNTLEINNEDNASTLDLGSDEFNLIDNQNFTKGIWNSGDKYTCDPTDPIPTNILIDVGDNGKGMSVRSFGQKVCIFEPILTQNIKTGGILKIVYESNIDEPIRYCIFGVKDNYCYFTGILGKEVGSERSVVKSDYDSGKKIEYLYIKDLSVLRDKSDASLYLYFNDKRKSEYTLTLSEVQFVTMPLEYERTLIKNNSVVDKKELQVAVDKELLGYKVRKELGDGDKGRYVLSFNTTKNSQWKLMGIRKDRSIDDLSNNSLTTYDYANGWSILNVEDYDSFIIVYIPQLLFLSGLILTVWITFFYLIFWFRGLLLKSK